MIRSMLVLAVLAMPGLALAQDKPTDSTAEKRLAELEAKLQSLLKELQALRSGAKSEEKKEVIRLHVEPKTTEKKEVVRVVEAGQGGYKVIEIGVDGKPRTGTTTARLVETKDGSGKRVVVVEEEKGGTKEVVVRIPSLVAKAPIAVPPPAQGAYSYSVGDGNAVHLTRVSYTLSAEQVKALEAFLKGHAKAKVLETKAENDRLVVTTTPDVQATVGQVVGLMTGKPVSSGFQYQWAPRARLTVPVPPLPAAAPKPPTPPAPPKPAK